MADSSYDTPTKERPLTPAGETDFPEIQGGRYRFVEVIGSGGAGTVYRALDTTLDKHVALKKLHDTASQQVAAVAELTRIAPHRISTASGKRAAPTGDVDNKAVNLN